MATCLVGPKLIDLTLSSVGWQWVNEGTAFKPKWGFVSTQPGSVLLLQVDAFSSRSDGDQDDSDRRNTSFPVLLQYLVSYTSMGQGNLECLGGCRCQPVRVDAHLTTGRGSWTRMSKLDVVWIERQPCNLRVTLMNNTSSGSHKFKVRVCLSLSDRLELLLNETRSLHYQGSYGTRCHHFTTAAYPL